MKKLRLIVTEQCNRNCTGCCNKDIKPTGKITDTQKLLLYNMVLITGGEPFLFPYQLFNFLESYTYYKCPTETVLYTAIYPDANPELLINILYLLNGITFTIHDKKGLDDFIKLKRLIEANQFALKFLYKRVNIFTDVQMPPINLYNWDVKFIEWIKNCPLPEDEELFILDKPWKK